LHCHYRTVSSAASRIALPECFLGMLPGWGGAFLVPNLIGAERAVQLIIENSLNQNKMLDGSQAYELGLADAMFGGADFLARSLDWAGQVIAGSLTVTRPEIDRGESWNEALVEGRRFVESKVFGASPGPYRALELMAVARPSDRSEAYAAEDEALADLIMAPELRASLYAFDLVQKRARKPAGAPDATPARPLTQVGIVGAGLMAPQLALLFLRRLQVPVVITDVDQERVDKGIGNVLAEIDKLLGKQRISPDEANRLRALISGTTELVDYADCDFVIEAVFEELSIKKQVFADLEKHVPDSCVLATNTSSLSVTQISADLDHPERVVGFHFFHPVTVLPLVEIVRGRATDEEQLATAFALAKTLKKNAVLVKDTTGFVGDRLLLRLIVEIFAEVDKGSPVQVADAALRPLGLPMLPYLLLQLVGPVVTLHVIENLHAPFGDRFPISRNLQALVAAGKPGIYEWTPDGKPYLSEETAQLLVVGNQPSTTEQVQERALNALGGGMGIMRAEEVVAAPMDIDLCLILGAGWPFHLGGITPYLDREGISE